MKNKYSLRNAISKTVRGGLFVGLSVLSMGLFNQVSAQVSLYAFSQSNGTYTEITGGTVVATCNECATTFDSQLFTVTLSTPFNYNGSNVTDIRMGVDGMLLLGTTTGTNTTSGISSGQTLTGIISALNMDLRNTTITGQTYELRYQDIGSEHVFQWKNASRWAQNTVERFSFQIRINKSSNVISVVYGEMVDIAASTTYVPQVGLRGATNSDYNARRLTTTIPTNTPTWDNTVAATSNSHNLRFTSVAPAAFPTSGLTFAWTPPVPCSGTPEAGNVNSTSQIICSGSTPSVISANGITPGVTGLTYQWQESNDNGVTDAWANAVGGTGATTASYTPPSFAGGTIYYRLQVTCSNGGGSDVTDAKQLATVTPDVAPSALVISNVTTNSMNIAFTNGNGSRRYVVINSVDNFTAPVDGSGPALIANNLYAGTGEQIVYDGTGSNVTVNGLSCNTTYFVRVYEYQRCGSSAPYSFLYLNSPLTGSQLVGATLATLPVMNDFTGFTGSNLSAVQTGFYEAAISTSAGATPAQTGLTGASSNWVSSTTAFAGNTTAKINLFTNTRNEWIVSPRMAITTPTTLTYKVAITDYADSGADPAGMQGTDDKVNVLVSSDCGVTWTSIRTFDASNTTTITNSLVTFSENLDAFIGQTIQVAFQGTDGPVDNTPDYDFHIDDINIYETPACVTPIGLAASPSSLTSGQISWTAVDPAPAVGYEYVVSIDNTTPIVAGTATTSTSVNETGLTANTTYYVFVRSNCGTGSFSAWSPSVSFTTSYCTPAPSSVDGNGIVQVKLNSIDNASTAETGNYGDYSAQSTDVVIGVLDTVQITYATGYTYGTKIWIDFNNNLVFEASELIYTGLSTNANPTTLNAPFTIPLSVAPGSYRMRIGGTDDDAGPSSACYTGAWGSFEDYTVNVVCPTTIPTITASTTDDVCSGGVAELTVSGKVGASFNWYPSQVGGVLIETDDTLTTTALTATTSYWVEQVYPTCGASARTEVIATVSPVNVTLTPIDNTCNGYSAGSFALGTVNCGTAPFEYAVNGGAFGAIPTNLAAGIYSVVVKDANDDESQPISVTIGEPTTVIATPTVTNAIACVDATSEMISAAGIPLTQTPVVVSFDVTAQPAETNAAPGNVIATATMPTLPAGAVITGATLTVPGITALGNSWQADVRLGLSGALVNNAAVGVGAANGAGAFTYTRSFTPTTGTGNTINILYWDNWNDNDPGDEATFTTGVGTATLTLTYTIPSNVTWWTAATGGTQIGTTASIEAIGSPVMASPAVAGTYTFYVQTETGTCSSVTRAPLTVTVTPNPTPTITASNPTLCDGSSIFLISSIATGNVWSSSPTATNDSLSVNAAGSYTVTVTDANGCVGTSAPYVTTITALPVISAGTDQTVCANSSVTLVGSGAPTLVWNNNVTNNTPFTATATTTYTVTGTAANGCSNTDDVTITVNPLPVPTITGDLTICSGDSTLLISSSETGNVWSTSATATNDSIYVSTAGTYSVTQTDANGCVGTSAPVTLVVNALPAVNAGNDFAVCQNGQAILSASGASTYTWDNNVTNNASFVVTQTTTYTVTGTDANGCQNTDEVTITTTALPAVEAGSNITQCGEQTVTLTATGATVYSWNNNVANGTAFEAPFGTSVYLVTGVDANGCANTDAVTVTIYEEPTATISVVSGVTLQASPANASYQWINCADESPIVGATSSVFTPTENGSYAVIVTGMGGCENTSACFNVTSVGVDKVELGSTIQLYPNPTTGDVFVNMNMEINASVVVMDAQGKIVLTQNGLSNGSSIQLGNFENGVYMIQVNSEIGSKVFRIVKN